MEIATRPSHVNGRGESLLKVNNLVMHFPLTRGIIFQRKVGAVQAVDGISFEVRRGETLGLVGESGCGKSTTGRAILQLYKPTGGEVVFQGKDLTKLDGGSMRRMRRHLQMIFQEVDNLRLNGDVERGDWLIGDDEVGVGRERASDADALALPA